MTSTNTLRCPICQAPTSDGLWCPACTGAWQGDLDWIAAVGWPELAVSETKRARFASSRARVSAMEASLPYNPAAREARDQIRAVLTGWAQVLQAPSALVTATITALTGWLHDHVTEARSHDAASDIWRETHELVGTTIRAIDRPQDREYLGECTTPECTKKHLALTCKPGAKEARCGRCGATYNAVEIRQLRRQWSDDQLVTFHELSTVYPRKTVEGWIKKGSLIAHGTRGKDDLYNLGDARALRIINAKHGKRHAK